MESTLLYFIFFALVIWNKAEEEPSAQLCGNNEYYSTCGTACQATCSNTSPRVCTFECVQGCFCEQGYIRRTLEGPCIPITQCLGSKPPLCGPNEKYSVCGTACPDTCLGPATKVFKCPTVCVEGCFCKKGFIKVAQNGACIPESSCSLVCSKDRIYKTCGSVCPATCRNPNPICAACAKICSCKDGLVEDEKTGLCIPPSSCPADE